MQLIDSETHSLKDAKLKKPQHPQQVMGLRLQLEQTACF